MEDNSDITEFEQNVYNKYLYTVRSRQNKPYRARKDFTNLDDSSKVFIKRISKLIIDNKLNVDIFFKAPFEIEKDNDFFPLNFYQTQKAISYYSRYFKFLELENIDSDNNLQYTKESLIFIKNFCKEKNITSFEDYFNYSEGLCNSFIIHLSERKISNILIVYFDYPINTIRNLDESTINTMFSANFIESLSLLRSKLYNSKRHKEFLDIAVEKVKNNLKNNISVNK